MSEQLQFDNLGNIVPCPYRDNCGAYNLPAGVAGEIKYVRGCGGERYWCGKEGWSFDNEGNDVEQQG